MLRGSFPLAMIGTLTLTACGGGGDGPTGPGPATQLAVRTQPSGAVVGQALSVQPVVEARDASGRLATGATGSVTASIGTGGGTISGTTSAAIVNGVATFTNLALSGTAGDRTLVFTSAQLSPATSTAFPLAPGTAVALQLATPPSPEAQTMVPLAQQPIVRAVDAAGNATQSSAVVTASVTQGNAAVAAGATATPNAQGVATFNGLTLGAVAGRVGSLTLQFSAPGLNPVSGAVDLRCAVLPMQVGQSINRALTTGDCTFTDGSFINVFELTTTQPVTALRLSQDGTFRSFLLMRGPNEPRFYWGEAAGTSSNQVSYKALLPAGTNRIVATSVSAGATGNYSVSATATSADITCELVWAAVPITTPQQLGAGDCPDGASYYDVVYVGLPRNATITASMSSTAFSPAIILVHDRSEELAAFGVGPGTATLTFANTTAADDVYALYMATEEAMGVGAYTLSINITYPQSATAPLSAVRQPAANAIGGRRATPRLLVPKARPVSLGGRRRAP
jgi:hypothetical protein